MESIRIFNGDNWPVVYKAEQEQQSITMCLMKLIEEAQELFGERDKRFTLLGVEFLCEGGPEFYWEEYYSIIRLSHSAFLDINEARGQCAHECVHLLSPTRKDEVTFLEEGVAMFYQKRIIDRCQRGLPFPPDNYRIALENVEALLSIDEYAIKNLRRHEPILSMISESLLCSAYPSLALSAAKNLVKKFYSLDVMEA